MQVDFSHQEDETCTLMSYEYGNGQKGKNGQVS